MPMTISKLGLSPTSKSYWTGTWFVGMDEFVDEHGTGVSMVAMMLQNLSTILLHADAKKEHVVET